MPTRTRGLTSNPARMMVLLLGLGRRSERPNKPCAKRHSDLRRSLFPHRPLYGGPLLWPNNRGLCTKAPHSVSARRGGDVPTHIHTMAPSVLFYLLIYLLIFTLAGLNPRHALLLVWFLFKWHRKMQPSEVTEFVSAIQRMSRTKATKDGFTFKACSLLSPELPLLRKKKQMHSNRLHVNSPFYRVSLQNVRGIVSSKPGWLYPVKKKALHRSIGYSFYSSDNTQPAPLKSKLPCTVYKTTSRLDFFFFKLKKNIFLPAG